MGTESGQVQIRPYPTWKQQPSSKLVSACQLPVPIPRVPEVDDVPPHTLADSMS